MTWMRILASAVAVWLVLTSVVSADCTGLTGSELYCCTFGNSCSVNGSYVDPDGGCYFKEGDECLSTKEAACAETGMGCKTAGSWVGADGICNVECDGVCMPGLKGAQCRSCMETGFGCKIGNSWFGSENCNIECKGTCRVYSRDALKCVCEEGGGCWKDDRCQDCPQDTPEPITFVSLSLGLAGLGAYVLRRRGQRGKPKGM